MGDANRQLSILAHTLQNTAVFLSGEIEVDFLLYSGSTSDGIFLDFFPENTVSVRCVMEIRDSFREGFSREVRKLALEGAKSDSALIKIIRCFRELDADGFHKAVASPVGTVLVNIIVFSVIRRNKVQGAVLSDTFRRYVFRYTDNV